MTLRATALRPQNRVAPSVPAQVPVTIVDLSQVSVRWHSKGIFYKGELVGLTLTTGESGLALRCAVRVFRLRRITAGYEVVGHFLRVVRQQEAPPAPAAAQV